MYMYLFMVLCLLFVWVVFLPFLLVMCYMYMHVYTISMYCLIYMYMYLQCTNAGRLGGGMEMSMRQSVSHGASAPNLQLPSDEELAKRESRVCMCTCGIHQRVRGKHLLQWTD